MGTTRDEFEPWLRDYLRRRCPELETSLVRAIDAFDTIRQTKRITRELLALIVEAASSSRKPLYENAATFLSELTGQFAEAREAVALMARDSRSQVRFNAILCLGKSTPHSLTLQLLRQGLRDKSASVRQKAADWAGRLRAREVVADLEEAETREQNEKAKRTIRFQLRLLRDGYILEPGPDIGFEVTTFTKNGIAGRWVSGSELKERGVDAIVADLAKDKF